MKRSLITNMIILLGMFLLPIERSNAYTVTTFDLSSPPDGATYVFREPFQCGGGQAEGAITIEATTKVQGLLVSEVSTFPYEIAITSLYLVSCLKSFNT